MHNIDKYELSITISNEKALFYSALEPMRDLETGCIGHLRADFGRNGDEFWNTWENHCQPLKTQSFKDEFDDVINSLRDNSILKNRAAMSAYCSKHPQTKITGESGDNYGFKIKTDNHVYYLRCNTSRGEYNLYCYAYERSRLEKCFPSLAPVGQTAQSDKPNQKVYTKGLHHAQANGEVKLFEESNIINRHCSLTIDKAITQSQATQGNHDFSDSASKIISEYGAERVKWVLANTVNHNFDGTVYSNESKEWAKGIKAKQPDGVFYYLHADANLIDEFIIAAKKHFSVVKKQQKSEKDLNATPTLAERLEKGKRKASEQDRPDKGNTTKKREGIE